MAAVHSPLAIGFLGAGQMATALAKGWTAAGLLDQTKSLAADPWAPSRKKFFSATGVKSLASSSDVAVSCDILVLAVKPQAMPKLLGEIKHVVQLRHLIISIAAGVTIEQIAEGIGTENRIVRVMPNTPCLVGESATGLAVGPFATAADTELVSRLFGAVGKALPVPEYLLDAVTGLSGSGPAFIYVLIEALADGGVRMGLPRDTATTLAAQTVLGAAKMVLETGQHPGALKDAVASPGGTTIAGLHALERGGVRAAMMNAVEAATLRATELGKKG